MAKPGGRAVLFVLLLQLSMFVGVPILHAQAEAAALATPLHISSPADHGCATHIDDLCQLCRWSTQVQEAPTRQNGHIAAHDQRLSKYRHAPVSVARRSLPSPLGPRAPPV